MLSYRSLYYIFEVRRRNPAGCSTGVFITAWQRRRISYLRKACSAEIAEKIENVEKVYRKRGCHVELIVPDRNNPEKSSPG